MKAQTTDEQFIETWINSSSCREAALKLQVNERDLKRRRRRIEDRHKITLPSLGGPDLRPPLQTEQIYADGVHIIFSDCHFWPDHLTDAYLILLQVIRDEKPVAIHLNGDAYDGAMNSRHPRIGWDKRPTVAEELKACKQFLYQVEYVANSARLFWQKGNHDLRFDTMLASKVPMYEGVPGLSLQDHFPKWTFCNAVMVNNSVIIKHRFKGGDNAAYNNTKQAGLSIVTGHTHRLNVRPYTDYRGTRYGIECGTLSDPYGPQYDYTEANPLDWQPGFVVLDVEGETVTPHTVRVIDGQAILKGRQYDSQSM